MAEEPDYTHHYGGVHAYLEQYVKTATNGKVKIDYALHVARMRLACETCGMTLTAAEPTGTDVDYGVQEFVKLHAHVGGHKDKPTGDMIQDGHGNLVPLTCDFKKIKTGLGKILTVEGDMIDLTHAKASLIHGKMTAYAKEIAEKMTPEALAKKITLLQSADYSEQLKKGIAELKEKGLMTPEQMVVQQETITDTKAELQALENILTLKNMQKKKQQLLGEISGQHAAPAVKREKPLKIATGRKFR